jgi:subtilisin family serine protease
MPHVYGVSYFSSKGPTGDGRPKPDLVAPGEKIISCDSTQRRAALGLNDGAAAGTNSAADAGSNPAHAAAASVESAPSAAVVATEAGPEPLEEVAPDEATDDAPERGAGDGGQAAADSRGEGATEDAAKELVVAHYREDSGTSMAAPHVSGVIAAFLSVRNEFMGKPEAVKEIFLSTATNLKRAPYFQGRGLVDLMRAIQSV